VHVSNHLPCALENEPLFSIAVGMNRPLLRVGSMPRRDQTEFRDCCFGRSESSGHWDYIPVSVRGWDWASARPSSRQHLDGSSGLKNGPFL